MKKNILTVFIAIGILSILQEHVANAAAADPYPHAGYVFDGGFALSTDNQRKVILELKKRDIKFVHVDLDWAKAELEKGPPFYWDSFDSFFSELDKNGIKLYLTLEGGVDGTVNSMPAFVSGRTWQIELGPDQDNSLTWDPVQNELTFTYMNQWLFMDWDPAIARRIDIQPGEQVIYTVRGKWAGSGARKIDLGVCRS